MFMQDTPHLTSYVTLKNHHFPNWLGNLELLTESKGIIRICKQKYCESECWQYFYECNPHKMSSLPHNFH